MSWRWGGAGTCYQAKGSWVVILIWSGGPNTSFTPALSTSSLIEADSSMDLLLGKSAEFVLGHLVGGVVFVPRLPPGGGSPGVHINCRMTSRCLDIHLRVDCVLGHLDCHEYISLTCLFPRGCDRLGWQGPKPMLLGN